MDNALRIKRDMISLEARNAKDVFNALTDRLPGFVAGVRSFMQNAINSDAPKVNLLNDKNIIKTIDKANYVEVGTGIVFIPPGLSVTYLEYIKALQEGQNAIESLMGSVLAPFERWVAQLLDTPENLSSLRTTTRIPGLKFNDLDSINTAIGKCFDAKDTAITSTFNKTFARIADIPKVTSGINELNISFGKVSRKTLVEKVSDISQLLDTLMVRANEDPEAYKMSNATVDVLAKLTYDVATEVEFYSVYSYQLQSLNVAIEDTYKNFKLES